MSLSIALLGFLLGIRHAVDPDHVVAIGTIATRTSSFRRAASIGALFGTRTRTDAPFEELMLKALREQGLLR